MWGNVEEEIHGFLVCRVVNFVVVFVYPYVEVEEMCRVP